MEDDWIKTDLDLVRIGGDAPKLLRNGCSQAVVFPASAVLKVPSWRLSGILRRVLSASGLCAPSPLECLRWRDVLLDQEQWTNDDFAVLMKRDDLAKTARHGVEAL